MAWYQILQDGPEYEARKKKSTFAPPDLSLKDVHDAVPRHLFNRSTTKSLFYIFRHLAVTFIFHLLATQIDTMVDIWILAIGVPVLRPVFRATLWVLFWGWQGMAFAGIWCLGMSAFTTAAVSRTQSTSTQGTKSANRALVYVVSLTIDLLFR